MQLARQPKRRRLGGCVMGEDNRKQNITAEEAAWINLARSLPPNMRSQFIQAAIAIASGQRPKSFEHQKAN